MWTFDFWTSVSITLIPSHAKLPFDLTCHKSQSFLLSLFQLLPYYFCHSVFFSIPFAFHHIYRSIYVNTGSREAVEWIKHKHGIRQMDEIPGLAIDNLRGLTSLSSNLCICKIGLIISMSEVPVVAQWVKKTI